MSAYLIDAPASFVSVSGGWGEAMPNGPASITFPLGQFNNYARLFVQPFIVHTGADGSGVIGGAGMFPNTYLIAESDRAPLGAGFVSFERSYAEIPGGYSDFETYSYTFPAVQTLRPQQLTATVVARVYNDYFLTDEPQSITLSGAQRFTLNGWDTTILSQGFAATTDPTISTYSGWIANGTEFVAQDATLSRFIGPIWQRQTYYVKAK